MGLGVFDSAIIVVVMFAVVFFVMFYTENTGKYIVMNTTSYDMRYTNNTVNRSVCKLINCSSFVTTVATTPTTTSSTLQLYFFNTSGVVTSLLRSRYGDALINCGNSSNIIDKVYFSGVSQLSYVFMTKLDEMHAAGCQRLFIVLGHNRIFDSGGSVDELWFDNYKFTAGDYRVVAKSGGVKVGGILVNMSVLDGVVAYRFGFGERTFSFVDDCSGGVFLGSDVVYCDDSMTEDMMLKNKPSVIITQDKNDTFYGIAKKYGIKVYSVHSEGDMMLTTDGFNMTIERKKGI
jgi:hypothetical protein